MARWIPAAFVILALGTTGSAFAQQARSPFPLADGNRWTLVDAETDADRTISVNRESGALVLKGLPGAPSLRVRWSGETVQAWDTTDHRWESVFRFGEPAGTSYLVRLGSTLLWRNVTVTVASKRAQVEDHQGRTRVGTRFTFASKQKIADAGIESFAFAPGIGPIRIVEQTIAGTRELALAAHRVTRAR
jgi:hypothetical protein